MIEGIGGLAMVGELLDVLVLPLALAAWFVAFRWVLPRMGVPT